MCPTIPPLSMLILDRVSVLEHIYRLFSTYSNAKQCRIERCRTCVLNEGILAWIRPPRVQPRVRQISLTIGCTYSLE